MQIGKNKGSLEQEQVSADAPLVPGQQPDPNPLRLKQEAVIDAEVARADSLIGTAIDYEVSEREGKREQRKHSVRVGICALLVAVLTFAALCVSGAHDWDAYYPDIINYDYYTPHETLLAVWVYIHDAVAYLTHFFQPFNRSYIDQEVVAYFNVGKRTLILIITLVCGGLLAVSGMLYQNVFRNPIAGPGMLGASSGAQLGVAIMTLAGAQSLDFIAGRYAITYGCGALVLAFVMIAGKWLSGRNRSFDIVTMMLLGAITGQLIGFVVSFLSMFVMEPGAYQEYYTLSQMLIVDTSWVSFLVLGIATLLSFVPIWYLRNRMNLLAFDEEESRLLGADPAFLRGTALVCGAVMILAAQAHIGAIGMLTVVIPFVARSLFGCEFVKQLTGSIALGMAFTMACRLAADCIPFIGDGISIGNMASVVILPLFVYIMATNRRGWE